MFALCLSVVIVHVHKKGDMELNCLIVCSSFAFSVVIVHGAKNIPMELDGLIMCSSCACSVVIVHGSLYCPMELNGLIMFNRFAYQSVASRVPNTGTLDHKPLNALLLAYCLLCMLGVSSGDTPSISL